MLALDCPLPRGPWLPKLRPSEQNSKVQLQVSALFLLGAGIFHMKLYRNRQPWMG